MSQTHARRKRTPENPTPSGSTTRAESASVSFARFGSWKIRLAACAAALLGFIAFANSFYGVFVLDDIYEINNNREMNYLLPPWRAALAGRVVPARPIPYYTFAIDTALWHRRPMGYHIVNVSIHLGSALMFFAIVRRTLNAPKLVDRYGRYATGLAFLITTFWVVHPIQTQAVTYIYQRIESLMSFFFLAAFYCFLRSKDSEHPKRWLGGSVTFALFSIMSKESAIAIPPVLFLYDVIFWTDSWRETVRRRWPYYAALLATFVPLALLLAYQSEDYEEFREPRSAIGYALSQPIVMLRYLELCFYPTEQCLDYLWQMETEPHRIVGSLVLVGSLFIAGVVGVWRRRPWGWLIAAFFLPLLPTSSLIPVNDLANEHRMYLALGSVATALVLGCFAIYRRVIAEATNPTVLRAAFGILATVAIVVLMCATHLRNCVYYDRIDMWEDVVSKSPHNIRAFENLASACLLAEPKNTKRAAEAARIVIAGAKSPHRGYLSLGSALLDEGDIPGAIENLTMATKLNPKGPTAYVNLAVAVRKTDPKRAAELYEKVLELDPDNTSALVNLANGKARESDFEGAENILRRVLTIDPNDPRALETLEKVLADKQAGS